MKKTLSLLLCIILLFGVWTVTAFADEEQTEPFTICRALGSDMVLQRDKPARIWGTCQTPGATVTVKFKAQTKTTTVADDKTWELFLDAEPADKNENVLTAECNGQKVELTGVLVGDVFLVNGQSNAEKTLSACGSFYPKDEKNAMIDSADNCIRLFQQGRGDVLSNKKLKDALMATPQTEPLAKKKWKPETLSNANNFSAIGFFFGHKMYEQTGVPIGLVMVASSGSPLSQLMSKEASALANYTRFENDIPVSGMYNALMAPFIKMSIKGMIFYQGESEMGLAVSNYGLYNTYLNTYVEDLRQKMDQDFPFYYVQCSSHGGDGVTSWPTLAEQRAVQFDSMKVVKNSGMVVSMDMGYYPDGKQGDWAHPDRKKPVGDRLAALVLCRDYGIGEEENVTSPFPTSAVKTDDGVLVTFEHVGEGLKTIGSVSGIKGFRAIVGKSYIPVEAEIIAKDQVLLKTNEVSGMTGIAYGIEILAFPEFDEEKYLANLGNSAELPAPTFKFLEFTPEATPVPEETPAPENETAAPAGDVTNAPADATPAPEGKSANTTVLIIVGIAVAAVVIAAVVIIAVVKKKKKE